MAARKYDRFIHSRVRIDEAGNGFTFRSSEGGTLDYILVYLWDRTSKTPKGLFTPMDVYRETILGPETGVGDCGGSRAVPGSYTLYPNRPNPFNPDTEIGYALPAARRVRLAVYDLLGREVVTLVDEKRETGVHRVRWDGRDGSGMEVGSGLYFYRMEVDGSVRARKMVRIK